MALICEDGLSECTGCQRCTTTYERCDDCARPFRTGDRYYKTPDKTVCGNCIKESGGKVCSICKKAAPDGFDYKGFILCRSCSGVATGYYGYV